MNCPRCKSGYSTTAKFCTVCGARLEDAARRQWMRSLGWVGVGSVAFVISILCLTLFVPPTPQQNPTGSPSSSVASSTRPAATPSTATAHVGDTVMVRSGKWLCGSTEEALDEMTKWAVRGDSDEMLRAMQRTGSFMLTPDGFQVKILDWSFTARKIRVIGWLDPDDGRIHAYPEDARIGKECWVATEAVTR